MSIDYPNCRVHFRSYDLSDLEAVAKRQLIFGGLLIFVAILVDWGLASNDRKQIS
jgi:hypothetical protein